MPVLNSPAGEWLLCLALLQACRQCLPLTLQLVSAAVPCCVSSLLTMPVLDSAVGEWLLCLAVFQAC
jgi:hypothetical protein